jgi:hypothetical protein
MPFAIDCMAGSRRDKGQHDTHLVGRSGCAEPAYWGIFVMVAGLPKGFILGAGAIPELPRHSEATQNPVKAEALIPDLRRAI